MFQAAFTRDQIRLKPVRIGTDKPYVYTGPGGFGRDRICYLVPNGSTYEGDPIWNRTVLVSNQSHVNRVDPYHGGSDPERIRTYPTSSSLQRYANESKSRNI